MSSPEAIPGGLGGSQEFATTHWSIVLRAAKDGEAQAAALEELCRNYWRPIYAYIRRRGHPTEEAQDLTQGFFERFLEKSWLADVDAQRARFRAFLLTMVSRYLANEFHRQTTQKRGSGHQLFSIHDEALENQLVADRTTTASPEDDFDRRWALTLLERALARLREETIQAGKGPLFDQLSCFLSQEAETGDYTALAESLKMSAGTVAVSVHRLRQRYRELVRAEVADTLANPADTEVEMQHLFEALRH